MGVTIPPGYGQVAIRYNLTGDLEPMFVTFGFDNNAGYDNASAAADFIQAIWTDTASLGAPSIRYTGWSIGPSTVTLGTVTGPVTAQGVATSAPSAGVGATLPQNCAFLVRKITARGGRAGRGRIYIPPCMVQEGDVSATGVILAGSVTNFQTRATAFLAAMNANDTPLVLLHSDPALPPDTILGLNVQSVIATQRTRLRR